MHPYLSVRSPDTFMRLCLQYGDVECGKVLAVDLLFGEIGGCGTPTREDRLPGKSLERFLNIAHELFGPRDDHREACSVGRQNYRKFLTCSMKEVMENSG